MVICHWIALSDLCSFRSDESANESPQLTTALKAYTSLTREQRNVLAKTVEGFVACLSPAPGDDHQNPHAEVIIQEQAWEGRASWSSDEWRTWETWGWYRHFCRTVGHCLCF